jgi:hypothetical protein
MERVRRGANLAVGALYEAGLFKHRDIRVDPPILPVE